MMVEDPNTGEWYDDGTGELDFLTGGSTNPWLNPTGGVSIPGDWNKYGQMEPYEAADLNQGFLGLDKFFKMLANPGFNLYMSAMDPGSMAYDYSQLVPGAAGAGMGGGGGGGYGGGGYQSVYTTDWSDAAAQSTDDVERGIFASITEGGQTPSTVINGLRASGKLTPEEVETYANTANKIFEEQAGFRRNQMMPAPLTPQQEYLAKAGIPDPTIMYDENFLPPDLDWRGTSSGMVNSASALRADDAAKRLERDANYQTVPGDDIKTKLRAMMDYGRYTDVAPRQQVSLPAARGGQELATARTAEDIRRISGLGAREDNDPRLTAAAAPPVTTVGLRPGQVQGQRWWGRDDAPEWNRYLSAPEGYKEIRDTRPGAKEGARVWADQAGQQANRERIAAANQRKWAARNDSQVQRALAQRTQEQGRTPFKDTLQRKIAMMRQMGLGI